MVERHPALGKAGVSGAEPTRSVGGGDRVTDSICRINKEACAWEFDARNWSRVEGSCSLPA